MNSELTKEGILYLLSDGEGHNLYDILDFLKINNINDFLDNDVKVLLDSMDSGDLIEKRHFSGGFDFDIENKGIIKLKEYEKNNDLTKKWKLNDEVIVIGIVVNDKKILMVRRRIKEKDLHWQFPGGLVEDNESQEEAIKREVREETAIICKTKRRLGQRIHPSTKKKIIYFVCDYISGEEKVLDKEELDDVRWMNSNEIFENITSDIFEPVREFLNTLR